MAANAMTSMSITATQIANLMKPGDRIVVVLVWLGYKLALVFRPCQLL